MHSIRQQVIKNPLKYFRILNNLQKKHNLYPSPVYYYATSIDIDAFTSDLIERFKDRQAITVTNLQNISIRHFMDDSNKIKDVSKMSIEDVQNLILHLMSKNKDSQVDQILKDCLTAQMFIGEPTLKLLFRHYSGLGRTDMVEMLQTYCLKGDRILYKRHGQYLHYLAKAQCMKGNSDKGLSILKQCYENNTQLRSRYRIIFKELIHDSVMNRSEASLVIFRKYIFEFSERFSDHYPLVCFWHSCWSSSWFSDQMLADELLESSKTLRGIIQDRSTAFSITILREDYNEDAVLRLLQKLLKFEMMDAYVKVLQVLFNFKLRQRDIRGCAEIMRNCEVLGVKLPSDQQGRYIKMLIHGISPIESKPADKPTSKNFKLKF
ncbi:uncharacterized protein LOC135079684 [Ostrinia nubilalis]|uniref:uncharacterized protein LOC114359652 n=1 Tax=Ostrinia furnacalis TaxID=93504 RepID=UPI001040D89B|nr:uncharacterized protein LOC114359652 [Ostrinia furnacalis]